MFKKKLENKYLCPVCKEFLVPWAWNSGRDKEIVEQYTCKCNGKSPAWYVNVHRQLFGNAIVETKREWSYINKIQKKWIYPKEVPKEFNPSERK